MFFPDTALRAMRLYNYSDTQPDINVNPQRDFSLRHGSVCVYQTCNNWYIIDAENFPGFPVVKQFYWDYPSPTLQLPGTKNTSKKDTNNNTTLLFLFNLKSFQLKRLQISILIWTNTIQFVPKHKESSSKLYPKFINCRSENYILSLHGLNYQMWGNFEHFETLAI